MKMDSKLRKIGPVFSQLSACIAGLSVSAPTIATCKRLNLQLTPLQTIAKTDVHFEKGVGGMGEAFPPPFVVGAPDNFI